MDPGSVGSSGLVGNLRPTQQQIQIIRFRQCKQANDSDLSNVEPDLLGDIWRTVCTLT